MDVYYSGMIQNEKSSFDGHWWPSEDLGKKRFGRLKVRGKYTPTLTIDSWHTQPRLFHRDPPCLIHGESESQVPFTLFGCEDLGTSFHNTRVGRTCFSPELVFWGDHVKDRTIPLFDRVVLRSAEILEILSQAQGRIFTGEDEAGIQFSIPKMRSLIEGVDCGTYGSLDIKEFWDLREEGRSLQTKAMGILEFSFKSPISIEQAKDLIERARTVIHFVTAKPAKFQIIELWNKDKKIPCGLLLMTKERKRDKGDLFIRSLRLDEDRVSISKAISACMQLQADLLSPLRLMLSAIHDVDKPLDYRFFDAARSFERAHGIMHEEKLIEKAVHKKTIGILSGQIPDGLPASYKERLISSLSYANGMDFRSRFREFLNRPYALEFFPNTVQRELFIERVTKTRNSIAHFTPMEKPEKAADFEDMRVMLRIADLMFSEILGCRGNDLRQRYGAVPVSMRYFSPPGSHVPD